jgi:PAS domain-containing protein
MEHERNRKQQAQLHQLFEEQHAQWQTARAELERRISVRKNELEEHIRKAEQATFKWKLMNEMVMRIFQANSLHELETFLFLALKEDLEIDSCRLRFPLAHGTTAVGKEKDATTVNIPLSGPTSPQGILSFHRFHKKFSKEEQEFLKKIAEPVLLAVDRILQNQMVEEILNQWQLTFDAITDPVLLINDQFEIIQSNAAFKKRSNFQNQAAVSGPTLCYQALFQRTSPCEGCKKVTSFL